LIVPAKTTSPSSSFVCANILASASVANVWLSRGLRSLLRSRPRLRISKVTNQVSGTATPIQSNERMGRRYHNPRLAHSSLSARAIPNDDIVNVKQPFCLLGLENKYGSVGDIVQNRPPRAMVIMQCRRSVKSGSHSPKMPLPLYPRKQTSRGQTGMSVSCRFCCKSQLRQTAKRDSVVLTRFAARSIHDGPSEE
jgi:hypothetical protein